MVDDSVMLRERLKDSIQKIKDVEIVGEATNGIDALQMIKDKKPDFVILDIRMPDMNGIKVLEQMKKDGSKCKVCIYTNYPYPQYKQKCFAEGADYFFDKNQDFNEIIDLIKKLSLDIKEQ